MRHLRCCRSSCDLALRLGVCLVLLVGTGCGVPPLADTRPSADALGRSVLEALARNDEAALRGLALSEEEFRAQVWPELPAARPERNLPFSYIWGDLRQKSDRSLLATLAAHGGKSYALIRVNFDETTEYAGFRVHRDSVFVVRTPAGAQQELRFCGSMIERNGSWKVFSYVVDE